MSGSSQRRGMRGGGIGGPLLCIGDLLSDVGEEEDTTGTGTATATATTEVIHNIHNGHCPNSLDAPDFSRRHIQPSHLTKLYQENYKGLNEALGGTDQSWTALTLELCLALETANKLIQSSNYDVMALSEKIRELERIAKKGDVVVREAEFIQTSTSHDRSLDSQNTHH